MIEDDGPQPPPAAGRTAAQRELFRLLDTIRDAPRDCPGVDLVALTGAYELSVHAWDLDQATGRAVGIPEQLVAALLARAPLVLDHVDRAGPFGPAVPPSRPRTDTDRLLALFGRRLPPGPTPAKGSP